MLLRITSAVMISDFSQTIDFWFDVEQTIVIMTQFLADRTNGRAYATVLRLSVCL